jgi:hypothetical protein
MYTNIELSKLIDKYGLTDIEPILENIENFHDLCIVGKAFIQNKLYRHIDYLAMFGKSEDSNGHQVVTNNLIELHQLGIFTRDGQINNISKNIYNDIIVQQRSYLIFYCQKDISNIIISKLLLHSKIYTIIFTKDNHVIHNVPKEEINRDCVNITRSTNSTNLNVNNEWNNHTNIWLDERESYCYYYHTEEEEEENLNFDDFILNECLCISIIFKEYKNYEENEDVTTILLQILKDCGIHQIIE